MNTNHIRQQAIAVTLGDLFAGTCEYTPDMEGARGVQIEPDPENLEHFRVVHLSEMAKLHQQGKLTAERVEFAQMFVRNVAWKVGHLLGQGWTGTWGVRMHYLDDIHRILTEIPANTELIRCGQCFSMFNNRVIYRVQEYGTIRSAWMGIKVSCPDYPEQLPFSFTINYHNELSALFCYNAVEGI